MADRDVSAAASVFLRAIDEFDDCFPLKTSQPPAAQEVLSPPESSFVAWNRIHEAAKVVLPHLPPAERPHFRSARDELSPWCDPLTRTRLLCQLREIVQSELNGARLAAGGNAGTRQAIPDDARMPASEIAAAIGARVDTVRKRLERWRKEHDEGWFEVENHGPRDPRVLYLWGAVKLELADLVDNANLSVERPPT